MIAILAVSIMLAGRLTHLAELNINPILDDRRIVTGVLYERMKRRTGLSLSDMWTFTLGFQHTARQLESADRLCGKDGTTGIIGSDDEPYKT